MVELKDLLARFETLLVGDEVKKNAIKETIQNFLGLKIENKDIKIVNNTVYLNIKPIYKSELFLKQEEIVESLKGILGKKVPKDIR